MNINKYLPTILTLSGALLFSTNTNAAFLTFDDVVSGATSYAYDGDGDSINDVIFSTTDPSGFNTVGPGSNMTYINEPGIEGSTLIDPDLHVEFLVGARDAISFSFALDDFMQTMNTWASFSLYDTSDNLLASAMQLGQYTMPDGTNPSTFPEGVINVSFAGTAAYGLFDFNNDWTGGQRYIIDNFEGNFGTSEVPEPSSLFLLGAGMIGIFFASKAKKNRKHES